MGLRHIRNEKGYTRKFVSEKLGISGDHLNAIERCHARITIDKAYILSNLYDIDVKKIISLNSRGDD